MRRRRVFRAIRWVGRLIGVAVVLAVAWLSLRWASDHWWLQVLLTLWALTFLPAGWVGVKLGRRNAMLLGFFVMAVALFALDRVPSMTQAVPLLALASAAWTFPTVNAYPMFVEPIPPERRGVLAALFLLCMALGGGIGDPMNGALFDLFGNYRPLFLMMAVYTALAFVAVLRIPRGTGEAGS